MLDRGEKLPVDFRGRFIYYVGPVDPVRGEVMGPAGPTTATRMDKFTRQMLAETGLLGMVGKAERGPVAIDAIREFGAVYTGLGKDGRHGRGGRYDSDSEFEDREELRQILFEALGRSGDPAVLAEAADITKALFTGEKAADTPLSDAAVALTVSDPFCVQNNRAEFLELVNGDLELLFANEEEAMMLFGTSSFDAAVDAVAETGVLAVFTRGAQGSVVVTATGPVAVLAEPVGTVVDTTGAGDLFAAGFLYGITNGLRPEDAARLGGVCAAEVISHVGARPQGDLRALAVEAGLFG